MILNRNVHEYDKIYERIERRILLSLSFFNEKLFSKTMFIF
jgi:hypothetical protein